MYDRMMEYLNYMLENTKKFSRINMMGPSNKEDLEFVYALQRGDIHVPESFDPTLMTKPMPGSTRGADGLNPDNLSIFNPLRWSQAVQTKFTGYADNQVNPFLIPTAASRAANGVLGRLEDDTVSANRQPFVFFRGRQ